MVPKVQKSGTVGSPQPRGCRAKFGLVLLLCFCMALAQESLVLLMRMQMRLQAQGSQGVTRAQGQEHGGLQVEDYVWEIAGLVEKELEQTTATSAACLVR